MKKFIRFFIVVLSALFIGVSAEPVFAHEKLTVIGEKGVYVFDAPEIERYFGGARLLPLDDVIEDIAQKEDVPQRDAYVKFDPDGKTMFSVVKEKDGKAVDRERLKDDILTALSLGGGAVKAVYNAVKPQIYAKDLSVSKIKERARFSTVYQGSSKERVSNIATATRAVSGSVVLSGEEFSFNDTVGRRSEQNGYKTAKIIVDGNFTEGLGGGVCQVSTTLYNAALLSGLKISESHAHSLAVGYVESSFDAMVSYGTCDLKFINTTDMPVYIKGVVGDNKVTFIIYGKAMGCVYERESVIDEIIKTTTKFVYNPQLDENEFIVKTVAKNGVKSRGYLIKKVAGKVVSRNLIRKDGYKPVVGLVERGNKSDEGSVDEAE